MEAEGWYHDPYERHEERWYSNGKPTALVRDAHVESKDPAPSDLPPTGTLVRSEGDPSAAGTDDLRRADDAGRGATNADYGNTPSRISATPKPRSNRMGRKIAGDEERPNAARCRSPIRYARTGAPTANCDAGRHARVTLTAGHYVTWCVAPQPSMCGGRRSRARMGRCRATEGSPLRWL